MLGIERRRDMSKIHYFQRYSTIENTVTNNTLQLLERIYDYSYQHAARFLSDLTGESIEIGLEINQQEKAGGSVPDGSIIQRSFKVVIESKVDSIVDDDQLIRHSLTFSDERQKILLLLTKQRIGAEREAMIAKKIKESNDKSKSVIFKNVTYEDICKCLTGLFKEYEYEIQEIARDYVEYCNDTSLFEQTEYLMRILPCGQSLELNARHGLYFHPSDRGYSKHKYIGIYANKSVRHIWEVDSVFDVNYSEGLLRRDSVQGRNTNDYDRKIIEMISEVRTQCGYEISTGYRFFCGAHVFNTDYVKSTPGGIQGARFVNLKEIIGNFSGAEEVAEKLKGKTWE